VQDSKADALIDPAFLFRFAIEFPRVPLKWSAAGLKLPESCRIASLAPLSGRPHFADVRVGWDDSGIGLSVAVAGKRSLPWCRDSRLEDSDGVHLWIDSRCSPNIHRATQYCHRFLFMPAGGGAARDEPVASLIPIHRARANPKPLDRGQLKIFALPRHDGYQLSGLIPADALTGFNPADHPRLGFYYAVIDRELGWQTMTLGPEYPVMDDPSLWCEAGLSSP